MAEGLGASGLARNWNVPPSRWSNRPSHRPAADRLRLHGADPPGSARKSFGSLPSPEVALALAEGAIERFGTDLGVGITGVAGPDGGTPEKPVGYVCHCVAERGGRCLARTVSFPGDRVTVRDRSTTVAMHLVRRLLLGQADTGDHGGAEPSRT